MSWCLKPLGMSGIPSASACVSKLQPSSVVLDDVGMAGLRNLVAWIHRCLNWCLTLSLTIHRSWFDLSLLAPKNGRFSDFTDQVWFYGTIWHPHYPEFYHVLLHFHGAWGFSPANPSRLSAFARKSFGELVRRRCLALISQHFLWIKTYKKHQSFVSCWFVWSLCAAPGANQFRPIAEDHKKPNLICWTSTSW